MTSKSALLRGAALGALAAVCLAATAQAAPARRAAQPSNQQLVEQIQALTAQVQALQARLDAQDKTQAAAQAQLEQAQAQAAEARTQAQQAVADSRVVQERLEAVPTQVKAAVAELPKPKPSWADSTQVTGRMYFNLSHIDQQSNGVKTPPSGIGFDIKRFYVGVDHRFSDRYSANVTTDVQYSSTLGSTHLFIKKAYLQANYSDALNIRLGAADMPWIPFVEDLYGYRHIEQTLTDRTKYGASADWGAHAYGRIGPYVSYAVAVVDGAGFRSPLRSKTMDVEGRVSVKYQDFTVGVGGYTGKLGKDVQGATNVAHTATRFNAVAAYVHGPARVGVEYFRTKDWNNVTTAASDTSEGVSAFTAYALTPQVSVFGRYDWVKPRKDTAPRVRDNYFNLGVQYEPVRIVDLALVYKRDKVDAGTLSTGNGTIGGTVDGTYDELGVFGQLRW